MSSNCPSSGGASRRVSGHVSEQARGHASRHFSAKHLFLGQASNYRARDVLRHTFCFGTKKWADLLRAELAKRYHTTSDRVVLMSNGRSALAAAIKIVLESENLAPQKTRPEASSKPSPNSPSELSPKSSSELSPGSSAEAPAPSARPKVIINAFTCYAVLQAVEYAGCQPVYADIDEKTLSFNAETLKSTLKKHPDAKIIVLQNTLGIPMDIVALENLARRHGLAIIEDLAHCAGRKYADGREIGSVGVAAALSFGKGKSLDAITGGALVISPKLAFNSPDHVAASRSSSSLDPSSSPSPSKSLNRSTSLSPSGLSSLSSLSSLSAPQRPKLSDTLRARWYPFLAAAGRCFSVIHLEKYWYGPLIRLHFIERAVDAKLDLHRRPAYWQDKLILRQLQAIPATGATPLRTHLFVKNRPTLLTELADHGYNFREIWYDVPISPVRYYKRVHFDEAEFPVATSVSRKIINLPTYYSKTALCAAKDIIRPYLEEKSSKTPKNKENR